MVTSPRQSSYLVCAVSLAELNRLEGVMPFHLTPLDCVCSPAFGSGPPSRKFSPFLLGIAHPQPGKLVASHCATGSSHHEDHHHHHHHYQRARCILFSHSVSFWLVVVLAKCKSVNGTT